MATDVSAVLAAVIHAARPRPLPRLPWENAHSLRRRSRTCALQICGCRLDSTHTLCERQRSYLAYFNGCVVLLISTTANRLLITMQFASFPILLPALVDMHSEAACILNVCPSTILTCWIWWGLPCFIACQFCGDVDIATYRLAVSWLRHLNRSRDWNQRWTELPLCWKTYSPLRTSRWQEVYLKDH